MADYSGLVVMLLLWLWSCATGQSPIQVLYLLWFSEGLFMESTAVSSLLFLFIGVMLLITVNMEAIFDFEVECYNAWRDGRLLDFLLHGNHQPAVPQVNQAGLRMNRGQAPGMAIMHPMFIQGINNAPVRSRSAPACGTCLTFNQRTAVPPRAQSAPAIMNPSALGRGKRGKATTTEQQGSMLLRQSPRIAARDAKMPKGF
ncbi:uncharacterized protein LOC121935635 [Sceloporus undulatus]|uniref:uncharacterized protein LOC121935635 n=1 Tax=Sceloporus undulatus TaxID=8520 RepID=UPI001C4B4CBA|nr:uncharacterized protein LOC121935635 [Sceloporus undulatus]